MLLFNNKSLDIKDFPKGNILENDYTLLKSLKGTIKISAEKIFQQGFFNPDSPNISDSNNKGTKFKSLTDYSK